MDLVCLYTSIDVYFAVGKCVAVISEIDGEFSGADTEELSPHLNWCARKIYVDKHELSYFCSIRYSTPTQEGAQN